MIISYFKTTFRYFIRQKAYSGINIFGLAIGMACAIIIILGVFDDLSYDNFHEKKECLYRVEQDQFYTGSDPFHVEVGPAGLAKSLKKDFPEIVNYSTVQNWTRDILINYGDKSYNEGCNFAEPDFFKMFSFPLLRGNPETALKEPNSVVITEDVAKKLFGNKDPMGKVLITDKGKLLKVTGVAKNIPHNTILKFDYLISFEFLRNFGVDTDNTGSNSYFVFVELPSYHYAIDFNAKIKDYFKRLGNEKATTQLNLFPFKDIYLYAPWQGERHKMVKMMATIAFVILLIASINFINLSTAKAAGRAKEIGVRKILGSFRQKIIIQFLFESLFVTFIACILAIIICELFLPWYNNLSGKALVFDYTDHKVYLSVLLVVLVAGITSGSYPAFFLSRFEPAKILKGALIEGASGARFRRALVIFQFTLSILLVISTIFIYRQLYFMKNKDIGMNIDQVVYFNLNLDLRKKIDYFKHQATKLEGVRGLSFSSDLPFRVTSNGGGWDWEGKPKDVNPLITNIGVEEGFLETFDINLAEGLFFDQLIDSSISYKLVINESFAKIIGKKDLLGARLSNRGKDFQIIGIMKDYSSRSSKQSIPPMIFYYQKEKLRLGFIKLDVENINLAISGLKKLFKEVCPNYSFDYKFADDAYDSLFKSYERIGDIFVTFAVLAILISMLGLFGLVSYMVERKYKEVGIRKSMGGTASSILFLFGKEFLKWVLYSCILAFPLAYYLINIWLRDFPYRTSLDWWVFLITGVGTVLLAFLTIVYHSIKVANLNPVSALKYD